LARPSAVNKTLDEMLGKGLLMRGDDESLVIQRIPFGLPDLDEVVGGGIPRKRITILTGEYSAGKSFLVQLLIKSAMDKGLQAAYLDTERSYDPIWWHTVGLDTNKLLISQPATGEDATDVAVALAEAGLDVIAIDSLAGMVPREMAEESADKKFIASQPRLMNRFFQKILACKNNAAIVCTNQLRSHLGPGPMDTMPGGWGQLFYTHLMLRMFRESWIEEQGKRVGFNMKIICRKSKVGTPFREVILPFRFRGEIDSLSLLLDRALEAGLIRQTSAWYQLPGSDEKVMGRNTVLSLLVGDAALCRNLEIALGREKRGLIEAS